MYESVDFIFCVSGLVYKVLSYHYGMLCHCPEKMLTCFGMISCMATDLFQHVVSLCSRCECYWTDILNTYILVTKFKQHLTSMLLVP